MKKRGVPSYRVPGNVGKVENEVLGLIVFRPSQNFGPVLEVGPGFLWCASTERRETSQELEEDAP